MVAANYEEQGVMLGSLLRWGTRNQDRVEKEFRERGPWVTRFTIGGKQYGGNHGFVSDLRVAQFYEAFPDVRSILELGSFEGGQSFELAKRHGVHVLGIEGRQSNIDRARFVQDLLKIKNVQFVNSNLETSGLEGFGQHDAVFCCGLLYHLPEPWNLIREIRTVSKRLYLWTHYAADEQADEVVNGFGGFFYREHGLQDPLSGLSPRSFWPTLASLQDMLRQNGFPKIKVLQTDPEHIHGPAVAAAAWAED